MACHEDGFLSFLISDSTLVKMQSPKNFFFISALFVISVHIHPISARLIFNLIRLAETDNLKAKKKKGKKIII
jgi:hypothetical protein